MPSKNRRPTYAGWTDQTLEQAEQSVDSLLDKFRSKPKQPVETEINPPPAAEPLPVTPEQEAHADLPIDLPISSDQIEIKDQQDQQLETPYQIPTQYRTDTVSEFDTISKPETVSIPDIVTKSDTVSRSERVSKSDTVSKSDRVSEVDRVSETDTVLKIDRVTSGFTPIPNSLLDDLAPTLTPSEWAVYLRLYRLSYGWNKDTCIVGLETLSSSTNIGRTVLREILKNLQQRRLIEVLETINSRDLKGTKYRINTLSQSDTVSKFERVAQAERVLQSDRVSESDRVSKSGSVSKNDRVSRTDTVPRSDTIKDHDHDDLLKTDHHQSAHERETMTVYQTITGNKWGRADRVAYQQIMGVPAKQIEQTIREVLARAPQKPATLAYFVKEILNPTPTNPSTKSGNRARLRAIVDRLSQANVGRQYSIGELADDVKLACARDGVVFDNDLFNEIIASRSRSGD